MGPQAAHCNYRWRRLFHLTNCHPFFCVVYIPFLKKKRYMSKCNGLALCLFGWHKIVKLGVPRTYYIYWARNRMSLKPKLKDVVSSDISDSSDPSSHNGGWLSLVIYTGQLGTFDVSSQWLKSVWWMSWPIALKAMLWKLFVIKRSWHPG